jgi:hypothetical protein
MTVKLSPLLGGILCNAHLFQASVMADVEGGSSAIKHSSTSGRPLSQSAFLLCTSDVMTGLSERIAMVGVYEFIWSPEVDGEQGVKSTWIRKGFKAEPKAQLSCWHYASAIKTVSTIM